MSLAGKPADWHVPPRAVTVTRTGKDGKPIRKIDQWGGVYAVIPGVTLRPAYAFGPPDDPQRRETMFQCPVSAIPDDVWILLDLWRSSRLLRTLPVAGGFLDQPAVVRRVFPRLEALEQSTERRTDGGAEAAALAVGAMVKVMGGGKK